MDKRLSKYLQAVESELRGLEPEQREAELREMRQHLEAIVARLMEGGLSKEEAVEAACAQFGAARKVGRELERVSTGHEGALRIVAAASSSLMCYQLLLMAHLHFLSFNWLQSLSWPVHFATLFYVPFLSGAVAGGIAPKWGGVATVSATIGLIVILGTWSLASIPTTGLILLTRLLGAAVGSRWASRRSTRRTDAQST